MPAMRAHHSRLNFFANDEKYFGRAHPGCFLSNGGQSRQDQEKGEKERLSHNWNLHRVRVDWVVAVFYPKVTTVCGVIRNRRGCFEAGEGNRRNFFEKHWSERREDTPNHSTCQCVYVR